MQRCHWLVPVACGAALLAACSGSSAARSEPPPSTKPTGLMARSKWQHSACAQSNGAVDYRRPDGTVDTAAMPRWIPVATSLRYIASGFQGCVPAELQNTTLDNGRAQRWLWKRSKPMRGARHVSPVFSRSGVLVGYIGEFGYVTVADGRARGVIPLGLLRHPPKRSDFVPGSV